MSTMGRTARTLVAGFDAAVMATAAYVETGGVFALTPGHLVLWGAALAAALCALIVYSGGSAVLAWCAIGYVLFGALLIGDAPHWALLALAVALVPLVPRPRGSLWLGVGVAIVTALGARIVIESLLVASRQ